MEQDQDSKGTPRTMIGSPLRGKKRLDLLNSINKTSHENTNMRRALATIPAPKPKDDDSGHYQKTYRHDMRTRAGRLYTKGVLYYGEYKNQYGLDAGLLTRDEFLKYYLWSHMREYGDNKILENHFNCSKDAFKIAIKRATNKIEKYHFNSKYFEKLKNIKSFDKEGLVQPYGI